MSRTWKWILGILGALIVVGLIIGAVFMWRNQSLYMRAWAAEPWSLERPGYPSAPGRGYEDYRRYHMMDEWGRGMPMMGYGYAASPYAFGHMGTGFMLFGGFLHMLLPLGILALVAYVFYQMGKRVGMASASSSRSGQMPDVDSLPRRKIASK